MSHCQIAGEYRNINNNNNNTTMMNSLARLRTPCCFQQLWQLNSNNIVRKPG
jgi:hypothetical protein